MQQKIKINLSYPLALGQASRASRLLLGLGHLALAFSPLLGVGDVPPLWGCAFGGVFFVLERLRNRLLAAEALRFSFSRLILAIMVAIAGTMFAHKSGVAPERIWLFIFVVYGPLALLDAHQLHKGKLGPQPLKNIVSFFSQVRKK